jgi:hypothetical protein
MAKKSVYLENIEKCVKNQIKWQDIDNADNRNEFLDKIIAYCQDMKEKPFKMPKSQKTRHG